MAFTPTPVREAGGFTSPAMHYSRLAAPASLLAVCPLLVPDAPYLEFFATPALPFAIVILSEAKDLTCPIPRRKPLA